MEYYGLTQHQFTELCSELIATLGLRGERIARALIKPAAYNALYTKNTLREYNKYLAVACARLGLPYIRHMIEPASKEFTCDKNNFRKRMLTDEQVEGVRKMLAQNPPPIYKEIATVFGCSETMVYQIKNSRGRFSPARLDYTKYTGKQVASVYKYEEDTIKEVRRLLEDSSNSISLIAVLTGVSKSTIDNIKCRKFNYAPEYEPKARKFHSKTSLDEIAKMRDMLANTHLPMNTIAAEMGVSISVVVRIRNNEGILAEDGWETPPHRMKRPDIRRSL